MGNASSAGCSQPASLARRRLLLSATLGSTAALLGCGGGGDRPPPDATIQAVGKTGLNPLRPGTQATRSWRMGFGRVPPRSTLESLLQGLAAMPAHADFAVMQEELPWQELLAGVPAPTLVERDLAPLADHIGRLGLELVLALELTDGLARGQELPALLALGRSVQEPAVRNAYAAYALAANRRLRPSVLGLATETNAVRLLAPPALYRAVVQAANAAAQAVGTDDPARRLMASVQVEVAWGVMPGQKGVYQGLARDLADFSFCHQVGLSSYPYFAYATPEDIPANYYRRLLNGSGRQAMVAESGWPSASQGGIHSSPEMQARYLVRHAGLLDSVKASGLAQLLQADLDLSSLPPAVAQGMALFGSLGIMDASFGAKPAQGVWSKLFARPLAG